jgi:MSHA biogenesis protein MshI
MGCSTILRVSLRNLFWGDSALIKFWKRGNTNARVGVEVRTDGIALAKVVKASGQMAWRLEFHDFVPCNAAERSATLAALVGRAKAEGAACNIVLPSNQYQIFQIERPAVEDSELAAAVAWKLKDLIDYPPEDAISDVFAFPDDATRGRGKQVNVVSARKVILQELVKLVEGCGLVLQSIDVTELALSNLAQMFTVESQSLGLLYMRDGFGMMVLVKGGIMYLSRKLDIQQKQLLDPGKQEAVVQQLSLQIQRSVDYFESQMAQIPPRRILLLGPDISLPLAQLVDPLLALTVDDANWDEILEEQDSENLTRLVQTLVAVGGAYREEVVS